MRDTLARDERFASKTEEAYLEVYEQTVICDSTGGAFDVYLPPVSEARGLIYSIYLEVDNGNVVVMDLDDSFGWSDMTMTAAHDRVLLYSDGRVWHVLEDVTT